MPWVQVSGALAAFALAILTLATLQQIKQQTPKIAESADVAKSAADTAANSLDKSVEQFRTDERAWVEIDRIGRSLVSPRDGKFGAAFRYRLYPRNVGKTPAHDIVLSAARNMTGDISLESNADNMKRAQDQLLNRSPTGPGPVENPVPKVLAPGTPAPGPFVIDGQEPQIHTNSERVSFLIGRFDYSDNWGIKHWMKFCFYVAKPNGELWNCHEGNDEDRNPETTPPARR
jgi:hypothetical protein